jgi:hypothetical protein
MAVPVSSDGVVLAKAATFLNKSVFIFLDRRGAIGLKTSADPDGAAR